MAAALVLLVHSVNGAIEFTKIPRFAFEERLVREELKKLGWQDADLAQRRNGEIGKVRIARQLRQETTMTLKWIAERLQMDQWTYVSNWLKGHGQKQYPADRARVSKVRIDQFTRRGSRKVFGKALS